MRRLGGFCLGLAGLIWLSALGAAAQSQDYRPWKERVADGSWRSLAAPTASDTVLGEWNMRIYSPWGESLDKHDRFEITSIEGGVLTGKFERSEETPFENGTVREEDGRTLLSFTVPASAIYWTQMGGQESFTIEAEFADGRFTGTAQGNNSELKVPWYARRAGEEDDMSRYVVGQWLLDLINQPDGFCEDRLHYFKDGTARIYSGEEVLEKTWRLDIVEPYKRKLVEEVTASNGKLDCLGNLTPVGQLRETYVLFRNGGGMALCGEDLGMSCYGTLNEYAIAPAAPKLPDRTEAQKQRDEQMRIYADAQVKCSDGDGAACRTVGAYRYSGTLSPAKLDLARTAFKSACDLGDVRGCIWLGNMMTKGEGGPKQAREGRKLLKATCTAEEVAGCDAFGALQFEGIGGRKDLKGARVSFERACAAGAGRSCHAYGIMLTNGIGGPRDVVAAQGPLETACQLNQERACEDLAAIVLAIEPQGE